MLNAVRGGTRYFNFKILSIYIFGEWQVYKVAYGTVVLKIFKENSCQVELTVGTEYRTLVRRSL